jgi:hypothetical protein
LRCPSWCNAWRWKAFKLIKILSAVSFAGG